MKKQLNTETIKNELEGSVFFPRTIQEPAKPESLPASAPAVIVPPKRQETKKPAASQLVSKQASLQASNHASMLALSPEAIEAIRKVVKNPGKEDVLYVRLTKEEKDKLADISYTYKRQGIRTSDNEVVRVAINALLEDYTTHGENSLLAIILASLHA